MSAAREAAAKRSAAVPAVRAGPARSTAKPLASARRAAAPWLAEIAASPPGPGVLAVFDYDGTLIDGYSIGAFLADRFRRRAIDGAALKRALALGIDAALGALDNRELVRRGLEEWAGQRAAVLAETGERLWRTELAGRVRPELRAIVNAHRARGHTLVLASSASRFQAAPAARALGIEHVLCTELAATDGVLDGRSDGPILWGRHKAEAVRDFAHARGADLDDAWFYADGPEDQALMHLVGHPRPVNPQPGLARVAARRGWPVTTFAATAAGALDYLRHACALGSVVPATLGALALRLLTGDARAGANLLTGTLPELALAFGGVRLAVTGEEHLWARRPAVFIWNHRNVHDAQIVGALVRRDFGAVAKRELARVPLFALASRFMPIAFVDRADRRAALAALEPVTQLLREGVSVVVAPEGTRVEDGVLGEFKKGAFRMAMAAGVPIVPIVIRNAEDAGARRSAVARPATIDVAVLPPVSVARWTRRDLDRRIAGVRQLYLDTLADWPGRAPRR